MKNTLDSLQATMSNAGLECPAPIPDGKLHRFDVPGDRPKSGNGWYVYYDGEIQAAAFGSWKTDEKHKWCSHVQTEFTPEQKAAYKKQMEAARRQREAAQAKVEAECREWCAKVWAASPPATDDHPYLQRKGVGAHGVRIYKDSLMVPVRKVVGGRLVGVQFIYPDGTKKFKSGTAKQGAMHMIGKPIDNTLIICEGYATGASIHEATGHAVLVAFDAGNLKPVAEAARLKQSKWSLIIAADDDRWAKETLEDGSEIFHEVPCTLKGIKRENAGITKAAEAAKSVSGVVVRPRFDSLDTHPTDFNDLHALEGGAAIKTCILPPLEATAPSATTIAIETTPLIRKLSLPETFPVDALSPALRNAAERMIDVIQAPAALVGQSLLAAVTLAVQPHVDVAIDGRVSPTSNNFLSVALSGERKSACDRNANHVIRERQRDNHRRAVAEAVDLEARQAAWDATHKKVVGDKKLSHEQIRTELVNLGERPTAASTMEYTEEPTYEGLVKNYASGNLSMGLFSDEGGRFLGGFAMSPDNAVKTITGLSKLWDGDCITRTRGGDGSILIYGVRLSTHLMIQPVLAEKVLSDPLLTGQGYLSRCLCCYPESTIGRRLYRAVDLGKDAAMRTYHGVLQSVADRPYPMGEPGTGLNPKKLTLDDHAKGTWTQFHDHIERLQKDGSELSRIRGFASKSAEHAARIAAVMTFLEDHETSEIRSQALDAAIELVQFYISEAQRLFDAAQTSPDLLLAEKALTWARGHGEHGGLLPLVNLYQFGPNAIRSKAAAERVIRVLEEHGQIDRIDGGCLVAGTFRRDVWEVRQ